MFRGPRRKAIHSNISAQTRITIYVHYARVWWCLGQRGWRKSPGTSELLSYIRSHIDTRPRQMGQWLFTGSQEAPLMQGVSEFMVGRAAILQLLPLSLAETDRVSLLLGV